MAWAELSRGMLVEAEQHARESIDGTAGLTDAIPLAVLAEVALAQGRADDALDFAARGLDMLREMPGINDTSWLRLLHAQAQEARGDRVAAQTVIRHASERLLSIADCFDDSAMRESYLTKVEVNACTFALAREWNA